MNLDQLVSDLAVDEDFETYPYDDKTGKRLQKGDTVQGTVTVGHGLTFLTEAESLVVVLMRVTPMAAALLGHLPWMATLTDARQRALLDMAYDLGIAGLLTFTTFLGLMQSGQYDAAAADLKTTLWAGQVHARATRIEAQIKGPATA